MRGQRQRADKERWRALNCGRDGASESSSGTRRPRWPGEVGWGVRRDHRGEPSGRDAQVRIPQEACDVRPVGPGVEHDADPALPADVGRPEVALWVARDEVVLRAELEGDPCREVGRAVVVIVEHRKPLPLSRANQVGSP